MKADLNDKDSLRLALTGAYAVFAITDWQSILDKEKEIQLGKNAADIAKELNIQHFIYSSLPDVTKSKYSFLISLLLTPITNERVVSGGKFTKVYHFDGKAIVENYIRELGIPATFFTPGIFNPFVLGLLQPISPGSKTYVMALPADPTNPQGIFPLIDIEEDAGNYIKAILLHREKMLGKQVVAAEKYYSIAEILRILKEAGGLDVVFQQISDEAFTAGMVQAGVPEFFAEDITENFKFMQEFGYYGGASLLLDQAVST